MIYKKLGRTREKLPVIGLGTWKIGIDSENGLEALKEGISLGARFVDTAEMYANEELVGKAIHKENVFLATKVSPHHFHYKDIIKSCSASIKKLGVESIDLYQLHWPNKSIPIKETMEAMEYLVDSGKIRYVGVSNFSVDEMIEAQQSMKRYEIVSNQVEYNPFARDVENGLVQFCDKEHITLIAYSPFARGHIFKDYKGTYDALSEIANSYDRSIAQIVLNYLISKWNSVVVIPKAGDIEHVKQNVSTTGFKIKKVDIERIDLLGEGINKPLVGKVMRELLKKTGMWARIMSKIEEKRK